MSQKRCGGGGKGGGWWGGKGAVVVRKGCCVGVWAGGRTGKNTKNASAL